MGFMAVTSVQACTGNRPKVLPDRLHSCSNTVPSLVKVLAWHDNEWGYSCRVVDLIKFLVNKGL